MRMPNRQEWAGAGRWLKNEMAEWFIGSWAMILGWVIVGVIFFSFLQMDGYFSRGLGEGSGVNPDLFMHIGWMFRLFAAVFLVFAVKLKSLGMKSEAAWVKVLGCVCAVIVIAHAMGFGLKALHGKHVNAQAIEKVADSQVGSTADILKTLTDQKQSILDVLAIQTAPLDAEITRLDTDGKRNEELATAQKTRRAALQDEAQKKIDAIDAQILAVTTNAGTSKAETVREIATTEEWAPLFVGLAQLFTQQEDPGNGPIFLAGVLFLMVWILFGDSICIYMPHALYKMHLKDAKPRHIRVSPDAFADLQAQADELARRKANLGEGIEKGQKTKTRKKNREQALRMIADQRSEAVKREEIQRAVDAEAVLDQSGEFQEPEQIEPEPELERTEQVDPPVADNEDEDQPEEKAA